MRRDSESANLLSIFYGALIALPFLFPIAAGPSVNVWQQLASWVCLVALLVNAAGPRSPQRALVGWFAVVAASLAIGSSPLEGIGGSLSPLAVVAATLAATWTGSALSSQSSRAPDTLAWALIWAGMISAVLGLLQYYDDAGFLWPLTTEPGPGQAFGNLRQRNLFASLISMALISALWLHAGQRDKPRHRRVLWVAGAVLLIAAMAASTSRTGLVEVLGIAGMAAYLARRERKQQPERARLPAPTLLLAAVPLYFFIAWLLPRLAVGSGVESMAQRLSQGAPPGHSRLILWHNVLTLISERPWTGWGWGELSYAHYMHSTTYPGARFVEILDNAHNLPLHLAVELGIPAAVLICGAFLCMVLMARPWRERDPDRIMAWALLAVIVLHSLLEYPLWFGPFQLVFGLCLGLLWPGRPGGASLHRTVSRACAAALCVAVAYAGWDYIRISQIYLPREERLSAYQDHTLDKVQGSWLFANAVSFARLTLTTVTSDNAAEVHARARRLLHFSPEPRVIVKAIESAQLLGLHDEARAEAERFSVAFPHQYGRWLAGEPVDSAEL